MSENIKLNNKETSIISEDKKVNNKRKHKRKFSISATNTQMRKGDTVVFTVVFVIFAIYAFTLLYSYGWAIMTSVKDKYEYINNIAGLPKDPVGFDNFVNAFKMLNANKTNLATMFFNSLWYAFGGTFVGVAVSTMSAYVVAKYKFPGRKLFNAVVLIMMMLPIVGSLPSQYEIYSELKILNSPLFLITFANGMGFNFLVLHGYFKSLPWDYVEASFIDGGNHFNTFFKIMLPQAKGVITALYVVSFIGVWNDYSGPILFLEKYPTLASGIYIYDISIFHDGNGDIPMLFAGVIMSVIPILALFIAFQEKIMNISIGGGLKG